MSGNLLRNQTAVDTQIDSENKQQSTNIQQISIVLKDQNTDTNEHVLMELQGDFEHSEISTYDQLELGNLKDLGKGNYEFKIGNHLLKGKVQDLQKPLILTEKVLNEYGEPEYQIKSIIRKKLIFATRPTPLRSNKQIDDQKEIKRLKLNQ